MFLMPHATVDPAECAFAKLLYLTWFFVVTVTTRHIQSRGMSLMVAGKLVCTIAAILPMTNGVLPQVTLVFVL